MAGFFAIFIALLFLVSSVPATAGADHGQLEKGFTSYRATGIEPNPTLNTNITWSTFHSGWKPLEYSNGTANLTLPTSFSTYYKNPISVNPQDIQAPGVLQDNNISGAPWQNISRWTLNGAPAPGETQTRGIQSGKIYVTGNTSEEGSGQSDVWLSITPSTLPSASLKYDYFTFALSFTSQTTMPGECAKVLLANETGKYVELGQAITPGQTEYVSLPLSALHTEIFDFAQSHWTLQIDSFTPASDVPSRTNTTLSALAITTTPLWLGQYNNGTTTQTRYNNTGTGSIHLADFHPNFAWSEIANSGYSVATSQPLQNSTTSQSSINSGSYIEQVTYQGSFKLPTAPDLMYTNSNVTMPVTITGNQFVVANLNGVSYTSTLSTMKNGVLSFGAVNPNARNTLVLEVDYTASQWNSVSNAPSFWVDPIGAIEYYWYIALGVLLGAIGLGAGMGSKSETFRVAKR